MRRILLPLASIAVCVALYLALSGGGSSGDAIEPTSLPESASQGAEEALEPGTLPEPGGGAGAEPSTPGDGRADASAASLPTRAVKGKIVVATACAADPELCVFAWSGEVEEERWQEMHTHEEGQALEEGPTLIARAAVDPDMSFRLEMKTELAEVVLYVRGRLAYSEEGRRVSLSDRDSEVNFATECGSSVIGRIEGAEEEETDGIDVTLSPSTLRVGGGSGFPAQTIQPEAGGEFVFRAVPSELDTEVRVLPTELAPELADVPRLARGETHEVEFNLQAGGVIQGEVVDPNGLPVEGAEVTAVGGRGVVSIAGWVRRKDTTDADGAFTLRGLPVGEVSVIARREGFLASGLKGFELIAGEEMKDVVLSLSEGSSVEGSVRWPDGSPVIDTLVSASFDRSALLGADSINAARGAEGEARTDEDGRFRITALGKGPFTVSASQAPSGARLEAWLARETQQAALMEDPELDQDAAFAWKDYADGVRPGGAALELVLGAPEVIAGRVVNDAGAPVEEYELVMIRMEESVLGEFGVEKRRLPIQDPEGRFLAPGLSQASWRVYALADGYATPAPTVVTIPQSEDAAALLITLELAASASGIVLTPIGAPAANALVTRKSPAGGILSSISEDLRDPSTRSDGSGRFILEGLASGALDLYASADGYSPSVPLEVNLVAGEETTDLRLSLRTGGTIYGEIYSKDGELTSNATIQVIKSDDFSTHLDQSDAEGAFRFENLEPGSWQVIGIPNLAGALDDSESNQGGRAEILKDMEISFVELEDGAEEHVVLGAPPEDPVTLSGVIRNQGEPVKGATLVFMIEGEETMPKLEVSDSEGRYSARLDKPGEYLFTVQRAFGGAYQEQNQSVFRVTVPKTVEHRYDVDLPGAMISGVVTRADGAGAGGVPISLSPSYGGGFTHAAESSNAMLSTNRDGSFTIDGVRPGDYILRAGGMSLGMRAMNIRQETGSTFGQTSLSLSIQEDERIDDLRLVVREGGSLEVLVTDGSGGPVEGASIFVRGADGEPVELISVVTTNARGVGTYHGLAEGDYQVSARTTDAASSEGAAFSISAGVTEQVELQLDKGTLLKVTMTDSEGEPVRARLRVVDSEGREHASYLSLATMMSRMGSEGFSGHQQTVGPLPPGRYRVHAVAEDGRETDKPVNLRGQDERTIRLRFR